MTDTDPDVDELEAQLNKQQQMIDALRTKLAELSQVLPEQDRRQFLKAGAGAGAILASGAIGRASAAPGDDGDTLWGSASNRDDYYADELDANLVSTGQVRSGESLSGQTSVLLEAKEAAVSQQQRAQETTDVSTTAKSIYNFRTGSGDDGGGFAVVTGLEEGTSFTVFVDFLLLNYHSSPVVVGSNDNNSPAARSYSRDTDTVKLSMASGTYNISVQGISLDVPV